MTHGEAAALCATIGARLCTEAEWEQACTAGGSCTWSYGSSCNSYQPSACNGNDLDIVPGGADDDAVLATGSLSACYADWGAAGGIYDLSGNVKEWTAARAPGVNPLRGGSTNNTAIGISCGFDFTVANDSFQFSNVGFRCCRTTAP